MQRNTSSPPPAPTPAPTRRWARLAGLAAAAVLASHVALGVPTPAYAAGEPFNQADCARYQGSPSPVADAWHVDRLRLPELHRIATGKGITIAVIDTGIGLANSPYTNSVPLTTLNFAGRDKLLEGDKVDCEHATKVTSLIVAKPDAIPGSNFQGIAPGATIISMRALQSSDPSGGTEPLNPTIAAVNEAVARRVDIINISQSGTDDPSYRQAIERAVAAGILVVAAAGNGGAGMGASYPASYPGVLAVGMTSPNDTAHPLSQSGGGMQVSVAAPGDTLVTLVPRCVNGEAGCPATLLPASFAQDSQKTSGTSFATPLVAGAAALIMERFPNLSAAQVKQLLEQTADLPRGGPNDPQLGHGIINPYRALLGPAVPTSTTSASTGAAGTIHITPPQPPDNQVTRNTALAVAGTAVGAVAVTAVITAAIPAGRRRKWRPAGRD